MITYFRSHPRGLAALAIIVAGVAWLAFGFFGVHTLFFDEEVSEALPTFDAGPVAEVTDPADDTMMDEPVSSDTTAAADDETADVTMVDEPTPTVPATTVPAVAEIVTEYAGDFQADAHPTSGRAVVLGNGTDQRFLRFEEFETDNGPDLNVYLVNSSADGTTDFVDLGDLKGNIGEQNYEIPAGVDLDRYDKVVVWCVRFGVGFGDALLSPA